MGQAPGSGLVGGHGVHNPLGVLSQQPGHGQSAIGHDPLGRPLPNPVAGSADPQGLTGAGGVPLPPAHTASKVFVALYDYDARTGICSTRTAMVETFFFGDLLKNSWQNTLNSSPQKT